MKIIGKESAIAVFITIFHTTMTRFGPGCASSSRENVLVAISNCGYDQVYECRVTGSGATVWGGSAFNCPSTNNEIISFFHSKFKNCSCGGAIVGRTIRAENNTYISQLIVSVNAETIGMSISCLHDSGLGGAAKLIGFSMLTLTTDPFPPPIDVYLMEANANQLLFQWESVAPSCEAVRYLINASNCGHCPYDTNDTTVTCTGFALDIYDQVCLLSIRTVVCGNITGNESRSIQVTLKVPNSPEINVIPTYSYNSKTLLRLTTRFNETETFDVADGVDGSPFSYIINYTINSLPGVLILHKTEVISVLDSCVNGTCEYDNQIFPSFSFSSSDDITVTVSGTNVLGNGLPSNPAIIPGRSDLFVDVSVDLASKMVTCFFHQQTENCEKYCSIEYGPSRENCKSQNQRKFTTNTTTSSIVVLLFPLNDSEQFQPQEEYCFTVTASNGTFTVLIEGTTLALDTWTGASSGSMFGTVEIVAVFVAVITITLLGLLIVILFVIVKRLKTIQSGQARVTNQTTAHRPANSEVDPQGLNQTNEQGIGIYSLLLSVGDEPPESQTKPIAVPDPVYVDIGPCTASQENSQMILVPPCDDKVEYAEVKQTFSTNSKPAAVLLDKHPDLDNLLIQLRDDVTPHWYEFGVTVGVPSEILEKCKDYPPDQCIVEVLDYWLMNHRGQLTWRNVAHALKEIQLHPLAEYILQNSDHNFNMIAYRQ